MKGDKLNVDSLLNADALAVLDAAGVNKAHVVGLSMGVGLIVDSSIVIIENIFKLRQKGIPMEIAVGSSALMVGLTASGGFAGHLLRGHWDQDQLEIDILDRGPGLHPTTVANLGPGFDIMGLALASPGDTRPLRCFASASTFGCGSTAGARAPSDRQSRRRDFELAPTRPRSISTVMTTRTRCMPSTEPLSLMANA